MFTSLYAGVICPDLVWRFVVIVAGIRHPGGVAAAAGFAGTRHPDGVAAAAAAAGLGERSIRSQTLLPYRRQMVDR